MRLAVELYDTRVGTLEGDSRSFDFHPTPEALARFGTNSTALSVAVPLTPTPRRDQAARRRNWFAELLPEGNQYEYLLTQGGIRSGDTLAFLARYGRDIAGALQIWDLDDPSEPLVPELRPVTDARIRAMMDDPVRSPLGNDAFLGKTSLGGVQPKITLVRTEDGWAQALGGYPTTHILKPQLAGPGSTVIFDEEYGSRLMRRLGIADFATEVSLFDGQPALVIERFDREAGGRLHQEDFNQALGAEGNQKYQEFGGRVSLLRVAETLRRFTGRADLERLARMVVAAVGLGNLDMHTKNLALLHRSPTTVSLAPAYDFVPQAHLSNDGRLALAVGGRYRLAEVTAEDLLAEFTSWRLRHAEALVAETLAELADAVAAESPLAGSHPSLQDDLARNVSNLVAGRPVGD
ncbi:serine/threonine-protein kinase HipA [Tessaracoccus bendigoensis DSM 12906]|uniref:Serine/threonine-protein kinase HipA n=1 Tax=Tessaracoccus bendigoensis DSM 12906 TaxID=1123357 RepID=A0A1M6MFU7_9ACTN|nr:HipA domain-containing protein [Tessaracoccus bendigoensis]SHJ82369.1 serine/threonine-protein kinase HipA [Tessaracoccus bendigoensis DSM 12906]